MKPRLLLCEDIDALRDDYRRIIMRSDAFEIVASVSTAESALRAIRRLPVDLLLTDIGLPGMDGINLIEETRQLQPDCICLVLTVFADAPTLIAALQAGANGYILKDEPAEGLIASLQLALAGEMPVSPSLTTSLVRFVKSSADDPLKPSFCAQATMAQRQEWSLRERDILNLAHRGLSVAEMGRVLGISNNTVKTHIKNLYRKLGVTSRAEAVYEAGLMGLLDRDPDSHRMAGTGFSRFAAEPAAPPSH
jgi:DNA-binding NarL/FixJ family response regulator